VTILETSLTGNQPYSMMSGKRIQWKGVDDDTIVEPTLPKDISETEVSLEAQRIRVFKLQFTPGPHNGN
jgi:hypothetical protein